VALPIDLRRYRGPGLVLGAIAVILVGLDLGLRAGLGPQRVAAIADPNPVDWSYYELFGSQVAGAERERHVDPTRARPFGVLLGASSVQRGPLPPLVEKETARPWLLLGIGGGTGACGKLRRSVPVLERAALEPDLILLGVHGIWLCDAGAGPSPDPQPLERGAVSDRLYARLQIVREDLAARLGGGTWAAFPPARDPWNPPPEEPYTDPVSPERFELHRELSAARGRFEAKNYVAGGPEERSLTLLLRELRPLTKRVVVALMPEHSAYRARVPAEAEARVRAAVAAAQGGVEVLDLRSAIEDARFHDNYHLTLEGRRRLSRLLGQRLAPYLK
jgi:hypothetical protein